MKKAIALFFFSLLLTQITTAQEKLRGNKIVVNQDRELPDFTSILIKDKFKVYLSENAENQVSVETDENLQEAIITRVDNGVLEVYISQAISRKRALNIYISVNNFIEKIDIRGGAKVYSEDKVFFDSIEFSIRDRSKIDMIVEAENASIIAEDQANIEMEIDTNDALNILSEENTYLDLHVKAKSIESNISNSSTQKIDGSCQKLQLNSTDFSNFKAKKLLIDYAAIFVVDKSSTHINVAKELILSADNSSEVFIYDNPNILIEKFEGQATLYKK